MVINMEINTHEQPENPFTQQKASDPNANI